MDLSYATVGGPGGSLLSWNSGYNGAGGVVYAGCSSCTGEITLAPDAGFTVTLNTITMNAWSSTRTSLYVYNADYSVALYRAPGFALRTNSEIAINVSSDEAIHIQWGPNAYGAGISAIDLGMSGASATGLPEPGAALLMLVPGALLIARRMRPLG